MIFRSLKLVAGLLCLNAAAFAQEAPCLATPVLEWQATQREGFDVLRNAGFAFDLSQPTLERLVEARIERAEESLRERKQTATEAQFAAFRKRVVSETDELRNRTVCFDGYRFNLDFFDIELLDVVSTIDARNDVEKGVRVTQDGGKAVATVIDYTPEVLLESDVTRGDTVALFNAGWTDGISVPQPLGFLKAGFAPESEKHYPGLSALVCIDVQSEPSVSFLMSQNEGEFAFDAWYFDPQTPRQRALKAALAGCEQAVQAGPRVVELDSTQFVEEYIEELDCIADVQAAYPDMRNKVGICETSLTSKTWIRSILAANTTENSVYFITTRNEVPLYDIQHLILASDIFGSNKDNLWAVNLAGGPQAFHFADFGAGMTSTSNLSVSIASAFRILPRQDAVSGN